jgi:multidrug resistance efflux pump
MRSLFAITDRQLARDRISRQGVLLAISALLAAAWVGWMLLARINVYATTDQARVEVAQAVYFVQAPLSGRVTKSSLELGRQVEPGDVLVELEADPQKLRIQGEETHETALQSQLTDLRRELDAQQRALAAERIDGSLAVEQARSSLAEAQETARLAQDEFKRRSELYKQGLLSQLDLEQYESDLKKKNIELESAQTAVGRAAREQRMHGGERQAHLEEIQSDIGRIEGELAVSGNTVEQLQHELGWRQIVAAGRGRLDETVDLKPGSYVREGDRLAAIVPDGQMRIVAYFEPRAAIGRVRPGQMAWLRLDGFPWEEYGALTARVSSVGSEVRDGRVRVELAPQTNGRVPLQHGLPGTLEVAVERVSPASFLLRKAGGYFAQPTTTPPVSAGVPDASSQAASP